MRVVYSKGNTLDFFPCNFLGCCRFKISDSLYFFWQETDLYNNVDLEFTNGIVKVCEWIEKTQVYGFLASLNVEYDQSFAQVLSGEVFPTLEQSFALFQSEDAHRTTMTEPVFSVILMYRKSI